MNNLQKCVFCTLFLSLFQTSATAKLFNAEEFFLPNGLQVVIVQNHKAPIVKHMVWYKAGAVDNEAQKAGLAHLLEHLMFRGTKNVRDGEFNLIATQNGIENNAFTSFDVTAYHEFADVKNLETIMALEADRMHNLNFDKQAFLSEQSIVLQERKQAIENNPASKFSERLQKIIWNDSPYALPVSGTQDTIKAITFADITDFYHRYYSPDNAILIISGDVSKKEIKPLINKYYGNISATKVQRKKPSALTQKFEAKLAMSLPDIQSTSLSQTYILPSFHSLKNSGYAYIVLAQYLATGKTSPLYKNLVKDEKVALGVQSQYSYANQSNSLFRLNLIVQNNISPDVAEEKLQQALGKAYAALDENALATAKKKILADLVYERDNPENAAEILGYWLSLGFTLDEVQNYEENIQAVSLDELKDAFNQVFYHSARISGILMPEKKP